MDPRIMSQDTTDVDQSLPTSGASKSGPAIGDTGDENQPTGEPSRSPRTAPIFTPISLSLSSAEDTDDIGKEVDRAETLRGTRGCRHCWLSLIIHQSRREPTRAHRLTV